MGGGTAFSQSPARGRPDESANARDRIVGLSAGGTGASSLSCERWHCRMGISISSRPSQSGQLGSLPALPFQIKSQQFSISDMTGKKK